jgi:hypothetical protein
MWGNLISVNPQKLRLAVKQASTLACKDGCRRKIRKIRERG